MTRNFLITVIIVGAVIGTVAASRADEMADYPIRPVPAHQVRF